MILLLGFDVRRRGGIERLTLQVQEALKAGGETVLLLTPRRIGPGWLGRQLGRALFLQRLALLLPRARVVLCMHVLLLAPLRWLRWLRPAPQPLFCWVHGIEVWGQAQSRHRRDLRSCDRLLASSHFTRRQLQGLDCPIAVVHPMADLIEPELPVTPPPQTLCLLTVARMCRAESYKGHRLVLEALSLLERRHLLPPGCRWDVVGDGDLRADLEALTRQLGLASRVHFLGSLRDRDLEQAFRQCSVFVMPSAFSIDAAGRARGEGFGIVYLEAAMAGRPSIACREGGQTDLIIDGETGWLIPPDSAILAALLKRLIADREHLVRCGVRARQRALRDFSAEGFRRSLAAALRT